MGLNDGESVCEYELQTAGPAQQIVVSQDVDEIQADGKDVCFLSFEIQDAQGVRVPDAEHMLSFEVDGPAQIIGTENGNLNSLEPAQDLEHKAYRGRGIALLQSTRSAGEVTVKVTADGLESASVVLRTRPK